MKQKIAVDDLRVGMRVSQLDRPWKDVPFEPPFELQGFTVACEEEIDKVKKHCEYVYITVEEQPTPSPSEKPIVRDKEYGALRNMRYESAPRSRQSHHDGIEPEQRSGTENRFEPEPRAGKLRFSRFADFWRRGKRRGSNEQPGTRATASKPAFDGEPYFIGQEVVERKSRSYGNPSIFQAATADDDRSRRPVYEDQIPVEQEMFNAREIMTDLDAVYAKVICDITTGKSIETSIVRQTVNGLVQSVVRNPDALTWLVRLKNRDNYSYSHSMAVTVLALTVGRYLGFAERELNDLGMGALLQDIGKIRIPEPILSKTKPLTRKERGIIQSHVSEAARMLGGKDSVSIDALEIVRSHHERYNGSGYPRGLNGDSISPLCAIAGISDTYEALVNHRPYRTAMTSLEALTKLYDNRDHLFSGAMIDHLIQCVGIFPVGSFVRVNTGELGIVVGRNRNQQLKPKVMLIQDTQGNRHETFETIDLATQPVGDESIPWRISTIVEPNETGLNPGEFFV